MAKLKKYFKIFSITFLNDIKYSKNFISQFLFFGLFIYVFSQLWSAVYSERTSIEGFDFYKMLWYFMFTESIMLSRPALHREMSDAIKSGDIVYTLNKPYSYILFCYSKFMSSALVRMFINMVVGSLLLFMILRTCPLTLLGTIRGVVSAFLGLSLNFLFFFLIGLSSFWFEDNSAFVFIYSKFLFTVGGLFVPLEFFPSWIKGFAQILPFQYILYAPSKLFMSGGTDFFGIIGLQIINIIIYSAIVTGIFRYALKRLNVNGG